RCARAGRGSRFPRRSDHGDLAALEVDALDERAVGIRSGEGAPGDRWEGLPRGRTGRYGARRLPEGLLLTCSSLRFAARFPLPLQDPIPLGRSLDPFGDVSVGTEPPAFAPVRIARPNHPREEPPVLAGSTPEREGVLP